MGSAVLGSPCSVFLQQAASCKGAYEGSMRRVVHLIVAALLMGAAPWILGENADRKADIQEKLSSQFVLTKLTADKSDIDTAGSILVLRKSGFQMCTIAVPPQTSNYKDGNISTNLGNTMSWVARLPSGTKPDTVPKRKFAIGEKFWVTGFEVQDDGVVFQLYSDPYADVRYWGKLKIGFSKKSIPTADELLKTIAEVLTVQPDETADEDASQEEPEPAQVRALAPIAPAPPPVDVPTISVGQTKDEVVAIFGQPQKVVILQTKEVLYYPDMKVTLVKSRVTNVE
jgi:hypothetical protein